MKNPKTWAIIWVLVFITILLLAYGCTSQKQIQSEVVKYDSTYIRKADSLSLTINKLKTSYEKKLTEARKSRVVFQKAPPCPKVNIDSACSKDSMVKVIRQLEAIIASKNNTVKILANGTAVYEGQIASVNQDLKKVESEANSLSVENTNLKKYSDSLAAELSKSRAVKNTNKKSSFLSGIGFIISLCILCFAAGYAIRSKTKVFGIF